MRTLNGIGRKLVRSLPAAGYRVVSVTSTVSPVWYHREHSLVTEEEVAQEKKHSSWEDVLPSPTAGVLVDTTVFSCYRQEEGQLPLKCNTKWPTRKWMDAICVSDLASQLWDKYPSDTINCTPSTGNWKSELVACPCPGEEDVKSKPLSNTLPLFSSRRWYYPQANYLR